MDTEVKNDVELAESAEVQQRNGLLYNMPQSLSSSVRKSHVRQYAQRQTYLPGQTMVFDMNVGSAFLDPENCFLTFTVTAGTTLSTATSYVPYKSGMGAVSLIEEVHIHAKSGVELDRIQECNQYWWCRNRLRETSNYELWGHQFGASAPTSDFAAANLVPYLGKNGSQGKRVSIPMKEISGLFCPTIKGMKMPNGLISGARIEITLEAYERAFGAPQGGMVSSSQGYTITDPEIVCLQHSLSDNSQRVLNEESADNGLEYTYTRVFTSVDQLTAETQNIQIKKAVSQGLRCIGCSITSSNLEALAANSFYGDNKYTLLQYRIGSEFYPQQKMSSEVEIYNHSMNTYNKQPASSWWSTNYSIDEYFDPAEVDPEVCFNMVVGSSFESDQRLNLSGVPINNSATLSIDSRTVSDGGVPFTFYNFLEYVAVATAYMSNVDLKI
jgi:hypothetical protein